MMRTQIVTSFSARGARLYGRRMVASFGRFWSALVPLVVYLDAPIAPLLPVETRATTDLADWVACLLRWAGRPDLHGLETPTRPQRKAYLYRYDVARFAVKAFVWRDAARRLERGWLTWFDGDTETIRPVPPGFAPALLGDADVALLGRGPMHPETGYVGFRIPEALPLLEWCCDTYTSDRVLELPGWTDCHVLRAAVEAVPAVRVRDLTGHLYAGKSNIWPASPLAPYVTHHKGGQRLKVGR